MSLYFASDHAFVGFFDADLFLGDLISGETRFCSRMLVNALLAWSSQSYAHYEPAAAALFQRFLDEAARHYEAEQDTDSLNTIAAALLMSMTCNTCRKDRKGMRLVHESTEMAKRLHLYDPPDDPYASSPLDLEDDDVKAAAAAVAWGSFNWNMLIAMCYLREPLVKEPPALPIPGDILADESTGRPLPAYMGLTHTFYCKLFLIMYEMVWSYHSKTPDITLATAEPIYQKLLAWSDELQEEVKRGEQKPDHVMTLHIWFHTTIIDLFAPFTEIRPQPRLSTMTTKDAAPVTVVAASIQQLKRLTYIYRATYASANYSMLWNIAMLYTINHLLRHYTSNEAHFYFLLCMRGYQRLARYVPIASGVVRGVCTIAMRTGVMLPPDAQRLCDEIQLDSDKSWEFICAYPLDRELAWRNIEASTLERLAKDFNEVALAEGVEREPDSAARGWVGETDLLATMLMQHDEDDDEFYEYED